jgi:hypothetical protein
MITDVGGIKLNVISLLLLYNRYFAVVRMCTVGRYQLGLFQLHRRNVVQRRQPNEQRQQPQQQQQQQQQPPRQQPNTETDNEVRVT